MYPLMCLTRTKSERPCKGASVGRFDETETGWNYENKI